MNFRAMDQVGSRCPLAVKVRVLSPDIPREICVTQWHWERFLYQYFSSHYQHHTINALYIIILTLFLLGQASKMCDPPRQAYRISGNTEQKNVFTLFCCNVFVHKAKYLQAS